MKYRPEIDGLRAVAVIPVILFHAGIETFSGGFVGVDVFFVISGYLITTIILSEIEQGTFSIVNFYERRARRILPALFLVMLVSLPFAWFLLIPTDLKDFSQSLVAVSIFSSNILFWSESGYWDTASELKPLLHTWSLAVEEQFYVLFPLFLILMWHYRKRWILGSFMLLAGVSLATAQWGAYHKPSATFYLLPTRGWELAIGAGIAFYFLYGKQTIRTLFSHKLVDEMFGLLGFLMIGYSIFVFNEKTPFPSFFTLLPTIGAGLIILFSSSETMIGRLLSTKLLVVIGLISYSAYLWHQPLLAYSRQLSFTDLSKFTLILVALFSIIIAYLGWRFVEKPFRNKDVFTRKAIFIYSLIGSMLFITIGLIGHLTEGFNGRSTNSQLSNSLIEKKLKVNYGLSETCEDNFTLSSDCRTDDKPEILIWGDSFAMHLVQGIMASKPDAKIIQMTKSVCGPFFDVAPIIEPKFPISWGKGCLEFTEKVREYLKNNTTVKYAVLSSPFNQYLSGNLLFRDGNKSPASIELAMIEFEKTLSEIQQMGIIPVVFSPPPGNDSDLGRCLARAEWRGINLSKCDFGINVTTQTSQISCK